MTGHNQGRDSGASPTPAESDDRFVRVIGVDGIEIDVDVEAAFGPPTGYQPRPERNWGFPDPRKVIGDVWAVQPEWLTHEVDFLVGHDEELGLFTAIQRLKAAGMVIRYLKPGLRPRGPEREAAMRTAAVGVARLRDAIKAAFHQLGPESQVELTGAVHRTLGSLTELRWETSKDGTRNLAEEREDPAVEALFAQQADHAESLCTALVAVVPGLHVQDDGQWPGLDWIALEAAAVDPSLDEEARATFARWVEWLRAAAVDPLNFWAVGSKAAREWAELDRLAELDEEDHVILAEIRIPK